MGLDRYKTQCYLKIKSPEGTLKMKIITLLSVGIAASCYYQIRKNPPMHTSYSEFDRIVHRAVLQGFLIH